MTDNKPLDTAEDVVTSEEAFPDASVRFAEAASRALHVDELLEHIPVFKTALAAANVVGSVRDHLLLRRLEIFLHAIVIIPASERRDMVSRLNADPVFSEYVGEYLIELLDRVDGRRKPAMIGAVFAAYAFEQIGTQDLLRLNLAIWALPVAEIDAVRFAQTADQISSQAIANAGLAEPYALAGVIAYKLNAIGAKFLELELDGIRPA